MEPLWSRTRGCTSTYAAESDTRWLVTLVTGEGARAR
eukprot:COSAG06_NODE_38342_length_424_cov_3.935385_1_plen_36_part_10